MYISVKMKDKTVAPLIELTEDGIIKSINVPTEGKKNSACQDKLCMHRKRSTKRFSYRRNLNGQSTAKMAELVAKKSTTSVKVKNALVRGQADNMPKDGAQLKLMLDNLEEQERAMTEMFSGTYNREEKIYTIR